MFPHNQQPHTKNPNKNQEILKVKRFRTNSIHKRPAVQAITLHLFPHIQCFARRQNHPFAPESNSRWMSAKSFSRFPTRQAENRPREVDFRAYIGGGVRAERIFTTQSERNSDTMAGVSLSLSGSSPKIFFFMAQIRICERYE